MCLGKGPGSGHWSCAGREILVTSSVPAKRSVPQCLLRFSSSEALQRRSCTFHDWENPDITVCLRLKEASEDFLFPLCPITPT